MKKLVILFGLFVTSSAFSMEFSDIEKITPDENSAFSKKVGRVLSDYESKMEGKEDCNDNPIYSILRGLHFDVACKFCTDIKIIMKTDSFLSKQIKYYQSVDSNPAIQHLLNQVHNKKGDIEKAKELIIQGRRVLAELKLQECQPTYLPSFVGEEKVDYIQRNAQYPKNEGAVLDYKALYIYLTLLADKVD